MVKQEKDKLADCIRSGYVGGQLVITRNIFSFSFFTTLELIQNYDSGMF